MITSERDLRIALEATLACTLAFYGLWGCAFLVVLLMLPWRPLLAVGAYLVQPIVEWRVNKARARRDKGVRRLVREVEALLTESREPLPAARPRLLAKIDSPLGLPAAQGLVESVNPNLSAEPKAEVLQAGVRGATQDLDAPPLISPAIRKHLQALPHGVFSDMDVEVEGVSFQGDTAEAAVKLQSLSVAGLVIRRRYTLRHADGCWQVEWLKPSNTSSRPAPAAAPTRTASARW